MAYVLYAVAGGPTNSMDNAVSDLSAVGINKELLSEIRNILEGFEENSIASERLHSALVNNTDLRWGTLFNGKALSKRELARKLRSFIFAASITLLPRQRRGLA